MQDSFKLALLILHILRRNRQLQCFNVILFSFQTKVRQASERDCRYQVSKRKCAMHECHRILFPFFVECYRMKLSCYFNVFTLYFDDNNTKTYRRSSYISNINKTCQLYEHTSICLICVDKCISLLKQQQRHKFNLIPRKNTFFQLRKLYQLNTKQNYICLDLFCLSTINTIVTFNLS